MNKIIAITFFIFSAFQIIAQINEASSLKLEHGILLSSRIDSDDDFAFDVKGFGIEGGYYILKKIGKRGMLSVDFRLAYAQRERTYNNVFKQTDELFTSFDTIATTRTGMVKYRNLSLAIPIKYRYQLFNDAPFFLLVGFSPYFNLSNHTNWKFDEFEYNISSNTIISEIPNQEEELEQRFFSSDLLLAGFGYKKNKWMFDIYLSGGTTNFNNDFIRGMDRLSIVLNCYYQLN